MRNLDTIELHDALIENLSIDFAAGSAAIHIAYYSGSDSRERVRGTLLFEDIEAISQIVGIARLRQNSVAGNISYWVPGASGEATYIYLADGCIAITARTVRLDERDSQS